MSSPKDHMAEVDASREELPDRQETPRCRIQRKREAKLQFALHAVKFTKTAKKPKENKPAHVSLSDPDAGFMPRRDGAIAPSYNAQFTTDSARDWRREPLSARIPTTLNN